MAASSSDICKPSRKPCLEANVRSSHRRIHTPFTLTCGLLHDGCGSSSGSSSGGR